MLPIALIATVLAYRNLRPWGPLLCLSMLAAGLAYASVRDVTRSPRSQLPEREVSLSLSIERLFEDNAGRARGFATVASSALSIAYFQTLPILGILANIVLLPLAFLAIVAGFLAILFGGVGIGPAILLFNNAAQVVLAIMHAFLESLNRLPRSYLLFDGPPIGLLLLMLSLLLVGLLFGYDRRWSLPRAWLWLGPLLYPALCILAGSL